MLTLGPSRTTAAVRPAALLPFPDVYTATGATLKYNAISNYFRKIFLSVLLTC